MAADPTQRPRDPLGPGEATEAFERLFKQHARLAAAQQKVRDERDRLDRMIADSVSTAPGSETWYAHPGVLTIDQVVEATSGGYAAVHRAMERYRKAQPSVRPRRPRSQSRRAER